MQLPRFRFTIGQLITLIAASAVCFAVLPNYYWLPVVALVLAIGLCLVGFTIERAQGGPGIHGATFAGAIGFAGLGFLFYAAVHLAVGWRAFNLGDMLNTVLFCGVVGGACGVVVGSWACMIVRLYSRVVRGRTPQEASLWPFVWCSFEDCTPEPAPVGGHRA